jgi:hypothetical protein
VGDWKDLLNRALAQTEGLERRALKKAAKTAGKALGRLVFGDLDEDEAKKEEEKPDPFAKLKAAEAERKEREKRGGKK